MKAQLVFFDCIVEDDGGYCVASSEQLGLAGSGETVQQAVDRLRLSVRAYIRSLRNRGLNVAALDLPIRCETIEVLEGELVEVI